MHTISERFEYSAAAAGAFLGGVAGINPLGDVLEHLGIHNGFVT
jgi:hypothetical protein